MPALRIPVPGPSHESQLSLATPSLVPPPACLGCQRLERARDGLLIDLENAEVSLRVERRRIKALLKTIAELEGAGIPQNSLDAIFRVWQVFCRPKARALGAKRRTAVTGRLREGYTHTDFALAIVGAASYPNIRDGIVYDDLELIARDATKMDLFIDKGNRANHAHAATNEAAWLWRLNLPENWQDSAVLDRRVTDIMLDRALLLRELRDLDAKDPPRG
jgi:hypothetical protein